MTFLTRGVVQQLSGHRSYLSARLLLRKMSVQAALAKLPSPLKDLVTGAAQDGSEDFGKSEKEPLDIEASRAAFDKLAQTVNENFEKKLSLDEVVYGSVLSLVL